MHICVCRHACVCVNCASVSGNDSAHTPQPLKRFRHFPPSSKGRDFTLQLAALVISHAELGSVDSETETHAKADSLKGFIALAKLRRLKKTTIRLVKCGAKF